MLMRNATNSSDKKELKYPKRRAVLHHYMLCYIEDNSCIYFKNSIL